MSLLLRLVKLRYTWLVVAVTLAAVLWLLLEYQQMAARLAQGSYAVEQVSVLAAGSGEATAVFLKLHNHTDQHTALVGATSSVAGYVELHQDVFTTEGDKTVQQVPKIAVPAFSRAQLQPGTFHVMLMDLRQALNEGESIQLELLLSNGSRLQATAQVVSAYSR